MRFGYERPSSFRPMGLARGAGCHLDPTLALSRALCEAAQTRLTRIAGTRDDIGRKETARLRSSEHLEATRRALALQPGEGRPFPEAGEHTHPAAPSPNEAG
jgi:ribosomal protein S12 methylthiotransferase accessory factor YcaO